MKLDMSGNPIKLIRSGAFGHLKFVTNLGLSHCDIETVEKGAFDGMDRLKQLKLDSNNLQHLSSEGLFPKTLHHVEVGRTFVLSYVLVSGNFSHFFIFEFRYLLRVR